MNEFVEKIICRLLTFVVEWGHVDAKANDHLSKLQGGNYVGKSGRDFVAYCLVKNNKI